MPILRRSDCVFTSYGYLSCFDCCDVGESAGKLCALCGVGYLLIKDARSFEHKNLQVTLFAVETEVFQVY